MGKLRHLFSILLLTTVLTVCASAQSNLTQIRDTIYNANGAPFNGTVVITWVGFSTPTSGTVSPLSTSARIYNGALSVLLVPSTTAAAGSYYQVVYYSSDGTTSWTETWSVPVSTNALSVGGVRTSTTSGSGSGSTSGGGTTTTGTGSTQYATLPIAISQITGLSSDLNSLGNLIAALTTTVTNQGSTITANGNTVTSLGSTLTGLNTTVTTNGSTLATLGTTVSGLNSTVTANGSTLSTLGTTVNNLSATVTSNGNILTSLGNTVSGLSTTVLGLTSNVNGISSTVTSNANNLLSLNSTVSGLSNSVANLTSTVNNLQSGGGTVNVAFVDGETPAGTLNGSNAIFAISQSPTPSGSLELYRNGLVQTSGVDYTVTGVTITFLNSNIPLPNDLIQAYYRVTGSSPAPLFADAEVPGGSVNGSNPTFLLAFTPSPLIGLRLYKNGVLLAQHGDYTISGQTITFVAAAIPQSSDALTAYYRH